MKVLERRNAKFAICPFCRESLQNTTSVKACSVCHTRHHVSCWTENGRCSVYGCPGTLVFVARNTVAIHKRRKRIFTLALISWLPFMGITAIFSYLVFKLKFEGIYSVCFAVTVAYVLALVRLSDLAMTCPACNYSYRLNRDRLFQLPTM